MNSTMGSGTEPSSETFASSQLESPTRHSDLLSVPATPRATSFAVVLSVLLPVFLSVSLSVSLSLLTGCASTRIDAEDEVSARPLPQPAEILVYDFAFRKDQISPESALGARLYDLAEGVPMDEREQALGDDVAATLAKTIVQGLHDVGLEARRIPRGSQVVSIPDTGVVKIEGQFMDVDAGNRLRRIAIGLGVGKSKLATQVQIFDSLPEGDVLVQSFSTTARSNLKPGSVAMIPAGPVGVGVDSAAGVALEVGNVSTAHGDAKRTGKLIVRHLAALAYQRGWISYEQARKAHADVEPDVATSGADGGA